MKGKYELLTLPGFGGSDESHWQSLWEDLYGMKRVEQKSWDYPLLTDWLESLHASIQSAEKEVILLPHSLACSLVAHYMQKFSSEKIAGVFFVAPADVDDVSIMPPQIHNFAPMPLDRLECNSLVVASSNDPYITIERAQFLAQKWGSKFVNIGKVGHINSESHIGAWQEGQELLESLQVELNQ